MYLAIRQNLLKFRTIKKNRLFRLYKQSGETDRRVFLDCVEWKLKEVVWVT